MANVRVDLYDEAKEAAVSQPAFTMIRTPVRQYSPRAVLALMSFATRRWRSAWLGIIAHSAQSVMFTVIVFAVVVS